MSSVFETPLLAMKKGFITGAIGTELMLVIHTARAVHFQTQVMIACYTREPMMSGAELLL
ncbi:MAG: hypothetical protein RLZZ385_2741 [Pseudomonadota bacterium]|jgi:hypothetical protein